METNILKSYGKNKQRPQKKNTLSTYTPKLFIIRNNQVKMKCELPALTPDAPAFFNPFFLTMKLAPMKKLEDSAKTNPFILSDDIPRYESDMASVAACSDAILATTQTVNAKPRNPNCLIATRTKVSQVERAFLIFPISP